MAIVEGVEDSILMFLLFIFVNFFLCIYFAMQMVIKFFRRPVPPSPTDVPRPPVPHNVGMCPICRGDLSFPVETNCGHLFCGQCLKLLWEQVLNIGAFNCPMCRSLVSLLFDVFPPEEHQLTGGELGQLKEEILSFVRLYNYRQSSNGAFMILDRVRDIPILLRHLFNEIRSGHPDAYLVLRLIISFALSFVYFVLPVDMIPERFFGIIGLVDDLMFIFILLVYVSHIYRNYIGRQL